MARYILWRLLCAAVGYLFGSILTGELVARLCTGKPARQIGTGNPGMANLLTHVGKKAGAAVLAGDMLKTVAACAVAYLLANSIIGSACLLYAGLGAICGHDFPLWAKGHGGKGVAVTCTWLALYLQLWGIGCSTAGGVLTLATGYLPLGAAVLPTDGVCTSRHRGRPWNSGCGAADAQPPLPRPAQNFGRGGAALFPW